MEDLENLKSMHQLPVIELDVHNVGFDDTLSGILGNRYESWEKGDTVFIHAPTGFGKTFFSLDKLYERAMAQGVEIAILVNRRLLRGQLWRDIREHDLKMNRRKVYLHLFSYQQLEGDGEESERCREILMRCRYVICDECHYFLMDALFNPGVQRSFDFITTLYRDATLVFMSATMEHVRPLIEKRILELHKCRIIECEKEMQEYDDRVYESCQYKRNGKQRSSVEAWEKYEEAKALWEYQEKMEFYEKQVALPRVREHRYSRDVADLIIVRYFETEEGLADLIAGGSLPGKWLVFVPSKKFGKELRKALSAKGIAERKIIYLDAEYDSFNALDEPWRRQAQEEIYRIEKTGSLQCQILITTSVMDNGINIKDEQVSNVVLMTEDEDEFKQMLGRRRLTSENETLNLFIFMGNPRLFAKRANTYFQTYWSLCDNRDICLPDAYGMLMEDPERNAKLLSAYYDFDGWGHHGNELAIEAVRMRCLYCSKLVHGLADDKYFFLKEQMRWIGKEFTQEWLDEASIHVSQEHVNEVRDILDGLYQEGGILNKAQFAEFKGVLIKGAEKIKPESFAGRPGSIKSINVALQLRQEWNQYKFISVGDDRKVYELYKNEKAFNNLPAGLTRENLEPIVNGSKDGLKGIFKDLFNSPVPTALEDDLDTLNVFINTKFKEYPGLEEWMLKSSGKGEQKKIGISKRPNSTVKK